MSKKHSFEFKLKVVLEYQEGKNGGYPLLSNKYSLGGSQLRTWVNQYNTFGEDGLKKKMTKTFYTGDFKLRVLKYRQANKLSYREVANHFEIQNYTTIANWQRKYLEEGFQGLNKQIGRPSKNMNKNNKHNESKDNTEKLNESEREELIRLREEVEYLRLQEIYRKKLDALIQKKK